MFRRDKSDNNHFCFITKLLKNRAKLSRNFGATSFLLNRRQIQQEGNFVLHHIHTIFIGSTCTRHIFESRWAETLRGSHTGNTTQAEITTTITTARLNGRVVGTHRAHTLATTDSIKILHLAIIRALGVVTGRRIIGRMVAVILYVVTRMPVEIIIVVRRVR